jgi:hypothetical protein
MLSKSRAAIGVMFAAVALVVFAAAPAFANTVSVNLAISKTTAVYGQEVAITPTILGTQTIPGDGITLETWDSVGATWTAFGEGLKVEDTDTVSPQYLSVDETFLPWFIGGKWTPTVFRATFKPVSRGTDTSGTALPAPPSVTSAGTVQMTVGAIKTVKTKNTSPKSAKRGKKVTLSAYAAPSAGLGMMRFTISGKGMRTRTVKAETEDDGLATVSFKFAKKGTYKITARWLGSRFGAASKSSASKNITIR